MQQTEATFAQLHAAYDEQTLIGTQNLRRILVIHADADNLDLLCEQVASHITPNQDSVLIERAGQGIETIQQIATYFSGFQTLLAGRIDAINIREFLSCPAILGFDVCQSIEQSPGKKSIKKIKTLSKALLGHLEEKMKKKFGGMYVPEVLIPAQTALSTAFHDAINDPSFVGAYQSLLRNYVGRQTPVTEATRLQEHLLGPRIFLKREDLNHTGSHKINNALGQCLLAKTMGKRKIIAETGAGQHGVATATACAHLGLACEVFMGHTDMDRQAINVQKMKLLGATVTPVHDGSATLKEAVNAALRAYAGRFEDTHYCLGSALGPEPYPEIVAYFQRVIGDEAQNQLEKDHGITPNAVIACVGGGSNAIGIFQGFVENQDVALIGVEAGGISNQLGEHASRLLDPRPGVLHGCYTYLLQDNNGQIADTKSIAAGLDYPAIGPQTCAAIP